ncbi:MAG: SWIM zinc finger family protein [Clostridia bacterium]|nr:SWIM zinc finger family protein [Clostridia bacterium]
MSLMSCASGASTWRGYNYFLERRAKITQRISNAQYDGIAMGSNNAEYSVHIDLEHVRKSSCNCPHADGKRIICKHMIALFFTAFPLEAKKYNEELIAYEREAELQAEEDECKVLSFVSGLKKVELQEILMQLLYNGPEWQWDKFIREYIK